MPPATPFQGLATGGEPSRGSFFLCYLTGFPVSFILIYNIFIIITFSGGQKQMKYKDSRLMRLIAELLSAFPLFFALKHRIAQLVKKWLKSGHISVVVSSL